MSLFKLTLSGHKGCLNTANDYDIPLNYESTDCSADQIGMSFGSVSTETDQFQFYVRVL